MKYLKQMPPPGTMLSQLLDHLLMLQSSLQASDISWGYEFKQLHYLRQMLMNDGRVYMSGGRYRGLTGG